MKPITTTEMLTGGGLLNCINRRRKHERCCVGIYVHDDNGGYGSEFYATNELIQISKVINKMIKALEHNRDKKNK